MICLNCKRTIKAIESINGVTAEVSVNFCPGCGAVMSGTNYEADNASCLQLCQSLFGDEWRVVLRLMPLLYAYHNNQLSHDEVMATIGLGREEINALRESLVEVGVKLARGE